MLREEIQTRNPGGIRDQPVHAAGDEALMNRYHAASIPDLRMPLPDRNVPAVASFACGVLALLFSLIGYVVVCGSPIWLARVLAYSPAGSETATLLALAALLFGVFGIVERLWYPSAGGLLWSLGGLVASGLTLCTVLETFGELASHWS
jgi:hypothetical protein